MLFAGAALVLLAAFAPASIGQPITDVNAISGVVRAPWFFLWVQQMLKWGDPFLWGVLVPLVLLLIVTAIPYFAQRIEPSELGSWFPRSARMAQVLLAGFAAIMLVLTVLGRITAP